MRCEKTQLKTVFSLAVHVTGGSSERESVSGCVSACVCVHEYHKQSFLRPSKAIHEMDDTFRIFMDLLGINTCTHVSQHTRQRFEDNASWPSVTRHQACCA